MTIQALMKSTKRVTEGTIPAPQATASNAPVNQEGLEKAKALARQINLEKNLGVGAKDVTQQTAEAVMKGAAAAPVNVSVRYRPKGVSGAIFLGEGDVRRWFVLRRVDWPSVAANVRK